MTGDELEELMARGHEVTGVEFKPPGLRTDRLLQAKVIKGALGMSNRRDGGLVIIGVTENGSNYHASGLNDDQLRSWRHDHIATMFSSYADPSIVFETEVVVCKGKQIVVLHVREFADVPVLCKKSLPFQGHQELREGACYVRSLRKPETAEVSTQEELKCLRKRI